MSTPDVTGASVTRLRAFLLGMVELRGNVGVTWDDDPYHPLSVAYDRGRDLAHRLTFRWWDQ